MNCFFHHEHAPLYHEFYTIHRESHSLTNIDILLKNELLQSYNNIILQIKDFDISSILGVYDDSHDPHAILYIMNYIFKPYKERIDYDNYEKLITRFLINNINTLSNDQIFNNVEIILPFF